MRRAEIEEDLGRLAEIVLGKLGRRGYFAGVYLVPNAYLKRLKKKYLNREADFVDVLAFPDLGGFPHPESRQKSAGEIYLNQSLGRSRRRLIFLLIHAVLHLCGYSHEKKRDIINMEQREKKLFDEFSSAVFGK